MDQVVGVVLVHLDFFEDDATLALDVVGGEGGIQHQVGEHVQGDGHMLGKGLYVEANGLFAGEGVEVAADGVHFAGNVLGRPGAGALEHHVFDEVGDAVPFRIFVARAGLQPDADGDGADVGHLLGDDGQAVRQNLTTNVAGLFYHLKSVSQV